MVDHQASLVPRLSANTQEPGNEATIRLYSKFSEQTNTCEFRKAVNLAYGQGGLKLEINIPPQHILAKSKGGLIIKGGVMSSEYGMIRKNITSLAIWKTSFTSIGCSLLDLHRIVK